MPFHRFTTPTYFGGLPGTHDLINVVSGGIGAGDGSAIVDIPRTAPHPNAGTYFVAFGEDATSGHANRGLKALAENTDYLDDIVHADQSLPVVTSSVVPGSNVSAVALTGNVFVGNPGDVNDQRTRSGLVVVTDGDGIPLHVLVGSSYLPVLVNKIHDGTGISVLGTGYYTSPTVDFSIDIPSGQSYRLAYYTRGNFQTQPNAAYTRLSNAVRGQEDLWAFAKTTRLGNITFTGTKSFQDAVTFQDDVTLLDTTTVRALMQFVGTAARIEASADDLRQVGSPLLNILADTALFSFGPITHVSSWAYNSANVLREYYSVIPNGGGVSYVNNASWDPVTQLWTPDDVNASASLNAVGNNFYSVHLLPDSGTSMLPATWDSGVWTGISAGGSTRIVGALTARRIHDSADPQYYMINEEVDTQLRFKAFETNDLELKASVADWIPLSTYYTVLGFGDSVVDRVPRLLGAAATSFEGLRLSWNAWWDSANALWQADTGSATTRQAYVADLNANAFTARVRVNTAAGWANSGFTDIFRLSESVFSTPPLERTFVGGTLAISRAIDILSGLPDFSGGTFGWIWDSQKWISTAASSQIWFTFPVQPGAANLSVDFLIQPNTARAGASRMNIQLLRRTDTFTSTAFSTVGSLTFDDGTANAQTVTITVASPLINSGGTELMAVVSAGTPFVGADLVWRVRLRYDSNKHTPNHSG